MPPKKATYPSLGKLLDVKTFFKKKMLCSKKVGLEFIKNSAKLSRPFNSLEKDATDVLEEYNQRAAEIIDSNISRRMKEEISDLVEEAQAIADEKKAEKEAKKQQEEAEAEEKEDDGGGAASGPDDDEGDENVEMKQVEGKVDGGAPQAGNKKSVVRHQPVEIKEVEQWLIGASKSKTVSIVNPDGSRLPIKTIKINDNQQLELVVDGAASFSMSETLKQMQAQQEGIATKKRKTSD